MQNSLNQMIKSVDKFAKERNWVNDDPNQLLTSAFIELGELAEIFQWKNKFKTFTKEEEKQIAFEIVDVLIYVLQIANKSGISDLDSYYLEKREKLAKKYPIGLKDEDYRKRKEEYRISGKNKLYE